MKPIHLAGVLALVAAAVLVAVSRDGSFPTASKAGTPEPPRHAPVRSRASDARGQSAAREGSPVGPSAGRTSPGRSDEVMENVSKPKDTSLAGTASGPSRSQAGGTTIRHPRQEPSVAGHSPRADASPGDVRFSGASRPVRPTLAGAQVVRNGFHQPSWPAVWADPGGAVAVDPLAESAIQQEAENLVRRIAGSGHAVGSPEYRATWDALVAESDERFRQRYGDALWMAHHIQAHHLAAAP